MGFGVEGESGVWGLAWRGNRVYGVWRRGGIGCMGFGVEVESGVWGLA